jgi:hypothetical protein
MCLPCHWVCYSGFHPSCHNILCHVKAEFSASRPCRFTPRDTASTRTDNNGSDHFNTSTFPCHKRNIYISPLKCPSLRKSAMWYWQWKEIYLRERSHWRINRNWGFSKWTDKKCNCLDCIFIYILKYPGWESVSFSVLCDSIRSTLLGWSRIEAILKLRRVTTAVRTLF